MITEIEHECKHPYHSYFRSLERSAIGLVTLVRDFCYSQSCLGRAARAAGAARAAARPTRLQPQNGMTINVCTWIVERKAKQGCTRLRFSSCITSCGACCSLFSRSVKAGTVTERSLGRNSVILARDMQHPNGQWQRLALPEAAVRIVELSNLQAGTERQTTSRTWLIFGIKSEPNMELRAYLRLTW